MHVNCISIFKHKNRNQNIKYTCSDTPSFTTVEEVSSTTRKNSTYQRGGGIGQHAVAGVELHQLRGYTVPVQVVPGEQRENEEYRQ
jgi:hypothetical protein